MLGADWLWCAMTLAWQYGEWIWSPWIDSGFKEYDWLSLVWCWEAQCKCGMTKTSHWKNVQHQHAIAFVQIVVQFVYRIKGYYFLHRPTHCMIVIGQQCPMMCITMQEQNRTLVYSQHVCKWAFYLYKTFCKLSNIYLKDLPLNHMWQR